MLPKGHLRFLGVVLNTQTTDGLVHLRKETLRAKLSKVLTEKLVPKT